MKTILFDQYPCDKDEQKLRRELSNAIQNYIKAACQKEDNFEKILACLLDVASMSLDSCKPNGWSMDDYAATVCAAFAERVENMVNSGFPFPEVH